MIVYTSISDVGKRRQYNEDSTLAMILQTGGAATDEYLGLFAVCDGMGGHAAGDLASQISIGVVSSVFLDLYIPEADEDWYQFVRREEPEQSFETRSSAGTHSWESVAWNSCFHRFLAYPDLVRR